MSEFKSSNFRNEQGSGGPYIVGVTTFTSPYYFVPPSGTTADRPSGDALVPGVLRFNTDIGRLEVWRGDHWATILGESPNLGVSGALGARGFQAGGFNPSPGVRTTTVDYITISTLGNAQDFGDLTAPRFGCKSCASSTRGLVGGGSDSPLAGNNVIDYITISSTGNATDFGDRIGGGTELNGAISNQTRGCFAGGFPSSNNIIDYVTISSTGNAQDFGDLSISNSHSNGCSSPTRGIFFGGETSTPNVFTNIIDYITISTIGNALDFGDVSSVRRGFASCSNATRGLAAGGDGPANVNTIEFVTIATLGNTQDFGDLTTARGASFAGMSSSTRGVFGGGSPASNIMDYVTITSTGNAIDFGDSTTSEVNKGGSSNAHGGL